MKFNKYEGMLGSVKKANKFANRMNACVDAVRSNGSVCRRDLLNVVPNPNYYLDMLESFGVVTSEIRAEEMIHAKVRQYLAGRWITRNEDGTVTLTLPYYNNTVIVVQEPELTKSNYDDYYEIRGYQIVQVRRKYWMWKA